MNACFQEHVFLREANDWRLTVCLSVSKSVSLSQVDGQTVGQALTLQIDQSVKINYIVLNFNNSKSTDQMINLSISHSISFEKSNRAKEVSTSKRKKRYQCLI